MWYITAAWQVQPVKLHLLILLWKFFHGEPSVRHWLWSSTINIASFQTHHPRPNSQLTVLIFNFESRKLALPLESGEMFSYLGNWREINLNWTGGRIYNFACRIYYTVLIDSWLMRHVKYSENDADCALARQISAASFISFAGIEWNNEQKKLLKFWRRKKLNFSRPNVSFAFGQTYVPSQSN